MFRSAFIILALAVAGCTSATQTELPESHPANAAAPVAALPEMSETLKLSVADARPQPSAVDDHAAHAGHQPAADVHAGHGAGHSAHAPAAGHAGHAGHAATKPTAHGQPLYVCPMHKEVTSAKPDDRCPKCKMKLVAAKPAAPATRPATPPAAHHDHSGHGGR